MEKGYNPVGTSAGGVREGIWP